jgi:hypothetical protein
VIHDFSVAALYEATDQGSTCRAAARSTLSTDEQDANLEGRNSLLARIIKGSWSRSASVRRMNTNYNTFTPKAISVQFASAFSAALYTRCVFIRLHPPNPERDRLVPFDVIAAREDPQLSDLRRKMARWVSDHSAELKGYRPEQPKSFFFRLAANWSLMFSIADKVSGVWPRRLREAAEKLTQRTCNQETFWTWTKRALSEMQRIIDGEKKLESIGSAAVIRIMTNDPDSDGAEFLRGSDIAKQSKFARLLHAYDIHPANIHPTKRKTKTLKGWKRE